MSDKFTLLRKALLVLEDVKKNIENRGICDDDDIDMEELNKLIELIEKEVT